MDVRKDRVIATAVCALPRNDNVSSSAHNFIGASVK